MRSRRLQNVAAGTAAQLDTKFDKAGGEISGDVVIEGGLAVTGLNGDLGLSGSLNFSDVNRIQLTYEVWYSNKVTSGSLNYIPVPTNLYGGGVLGNDGLIYCIPNSSNVLIINSNDGTITFDNTSITGSFGAYRGGALADNGNIYCAPVSAATDTILVIEPSTQTTRTIGPYTVVGTSNQFFGATKGLDGKIYFASQANSNLLIVDPTVTPEMITEIPIPGFANVGQYSDAVTGHNGKIYFIPWNSDKVLVYNPTSNIFTELTSPLFTAGGSKWTSGVITDSGFIYCSPRAATAVLIIDTNTDTLDFTSITGLSSNPAKYYGSSIGKDGNVYFTPFGVNNILKINPTNNTVEYIPVNLTVGNGWLGSVVANDGNIIHIPFGASEILVQSPFRTLQINGNTNINGALRTEEVTATDSLLLAPANLVSVQGGFSRGPPVTKDADFAVSPTDNWIICNGSSTIVVTLPAASASIGRELMFKNVAAQPVNSSASNVVPLVGGAAGSAILPATPGETAKLVCDGTNWVRML